jgi:hypothetical protein
MAGGVDQERGVDAAGVVDDAVGDVLSLCMGRSDRSLGHRGCRCQAKAAALQGLRVLRPGPLLLGDDADQRPQLFVPRSGGGALG